MRKGENMKKGVLSVVSSDCRIIGMMCGFEGEDSVRTPFFESGHHSYFRLGNRVVFASKKFLVKKKGRFVWTEGLSGRYIGRFKTLLLLLLSNQSKKSNKIKYKVLFWDFFQTETFCFFLTGSPDADMTLKT